MILKDKFLVIFFIFEQNLKENVCKLLKRNNNYYHIINQNRKNKTGKIKTGPEQKGRKRTKSQYKRDLLNIDLKKYPPALPASYRHAPDFRRLLTPLKKTVFERF